MTRTSGLAVFALTVAVVQGMVAVPHEAAAAEQASEVIAGEVTKIDRDRRRVTVRSSEGTPHEFEAPDETLKDLKVGDRIEAKRRPEKN